MSFIPKSTNTRQRVMLVVAVLALGAAGVVVYRNLNESTPPPAVPDVAPVPADSATAPVPAKAPSASRPVRDTASDAPPSLGPRRVAPGAK